MTYHTLKGAAHLFARTALLSMLLLLPILFWACDPDGGGKPDKGPDPCPTLAPYTLKATALTLNGSALQKPSSFLVWDITQTNTLDIRSDCSKTSHVEFLLVAVDPVTGVVKQPPATVADFRKSGPVSLYNKAIKNGNAPAEPTVPFYYASALVSGEVTSLYLGHDSQGHFPLDENTSYTLYALQPDSSAPTTITDLGSFSTGARPVAPGGAEDPSTANNTGKFYTRPGQFIVFNNFFADSSSNASTIVIQNDGDTVLTSTVSAATPFYFNVGLPSPATTGYILSVPLFKYFDTYSSFKVRNLAFTRSGKIDFVLVK